MDIYDFYQTIETRADFIKFLDLLHAEYLKRGQEWENSSLDGYIEAMGAYSASGLSHVPSWKNFAGIFLGAIVYE